jgi:arachidonate 15-lipoxygenase
MAHVQVADTLHHEMSSHLARCHFTMEPIAIAIHRTLADEHPIALLLNTHMRFVIANDSVAAYTLRAHLL